MKLTLTVYVPSTAELTDVLSRGTFACGHKLVGVTATTGEPVLLTEDAIPVTITIETESE